MVFLPFFGGKVLGFKRAIFQLWFSETIFKIWIQTGCVYSDEAANRNQIYRRRRPVILDLFKRSNWANSAVAAAWRTAEGSWDSVGCNYFLHPPKLEWVIKLTIGGIFGFLVSYWVTNREKGAFHSCAMVMEHVVLMHHRLKKESFYMSASFKLTLTCLWDINKWKRKDI